MRYGLSTLSVLCLICCAAISGEAQHFEEILAGWIPSAVGVGWGDYDEDGYADLFVAGTDQGIPYPREHGPLLYHNNSDLTFSEVSESLNLASSPIEQDGVAWGDYDNDGDLDVLVGSGAGHPMLYRRDATGFVEVGESAGIHAASGAGRGVTWCDYNGDNLLDAFCSSRFGSAYLMRNDGDGAFTDVWASFGLSPCDSAESASWGDYNNDGWPDVVVARAVEPTLLFRNNGDGAFTDVSDESGVSAFPDGMSAIWGDYDNDGWLDCYVTSGPYLEPSTRRDALFHNDGDGTFSDVSATAGMVGDECVAAGAVWADFNNDGYLDVYVSNWGESPFLYRNNGNGTFANLISGSGLDDVHQKEGAACADMDRDGRLDLVQGISDGWTRLFRSIGYAGNWLRVSVLTDGDGDSTDGDPARPAIGARVELNLDNDDSFASGRTLIREIDGGSGYCGQNEQVAHFGVGVSTVVCVRVRFPDGSVVTHRDVAVNQQIEIKDIPADRTEEIFDDVPLDFWAYEDVKGCVDASIVAGYDDGLYHGDWAVTRGQMAVYIARALVAPSGEAALADYVPSDPRNFPDAPPTGYGDDGTEPYWAYTHIEYCVENGVVQGYLDGNYHPDEEVNRAQMAVYVARALVSPSGEAGLADYVPADPRNFPDAADTGYGDDGTEPYWAYTHVEYCVEHGVVQGYLDGNYHPDEVVTRAQMAVYVARAFELTT